MYQRLSFLYQTSTYLAQLGSGSVDGSEQNQDRSKRKRGNLTQSGKDSLLNLSRQYTHSMKSIGQKAVLRMYDDLAG